ncbi:MAG: hypothetical protein LRY51_03690 [Geovibrio sp.]|nr:hypothetical protein [Geovibrio sp.]
MKKTAVFLCVFLAAASAGADFRKLLPLLPDIGGYSASPAEGSTLRLRAAMLTPLPEDIPLHPHPLFFPFTPALMSELWRSTG